MQFRLRTLLILLAVLPPILAGAWFAREAVVVGTTIAATFILAGILLGFGIAFVCWIADFVLGKR